MESEPRVVVLGGGFGGLYAARALADAPVRVTLVDRRNFHLFQPLLYQVATGGLSPANIAAPLRSVLRRQDNAEVLLAEAVDVDPERRVLVLSDGEVPYDYLVVAAGSTLHYFGNSAWEPVAPGLKTLEDATEIRRRILLAFEVAERETDPDVVRSLLTFVVVGAGPTGVELAGALAEIARETLRGDFRHIDPSSARIVLVDAAERVLATYPPELSARAARSLGELGVEVMTGAKVTHLSSGSIALRRGEHVERIPAANVFWAAGVRASPFGERLQQRTGARLDGQGRVFVQPDLSLPGHPEVFVIGDLARVESGGAPLPGVAPVAMQQGRHVAKAVHARLHGKEVSAFRYRDRGSMAVIGRTRAVADMPVARFGGFVAWLAWLFVHLMYLVGFGSRVLVMVQWAWAYLTFGRSARLITGPNPLPFAKQSQAPEDERKVA